MTFTEKEIHIKNIFLDIKNPRHDPIENEEDIIHYLITKENVKQLAKHISKIGQISPLEKIAVIPHSKINGAYIAVEGNRRVCAMKLLAHPNKADNDKNIAYFKRLALDMIAIPSIVDVVVFNSPSEARPWISLRHEGEQDGIGTKAWNSSQKARFNANGSSEEKNPNIQAYLLKTYVKDNQLIDLDDLEKLSITTITRYLGTPAFRTALGLIDNKTLRVSVPKDEFEQVIKHFLLDMLYEKESVNSRSHAAERVAYSESLRANNIAPSTRDLPIYDISTVKKPTIQAKPLPQKFDNRSPDTRSFIIPKKYTAKINDPVLKRLYDELKK